MVAILAITFATTGHCIKCTDHDHHSDAQLETAHASNAHLDDHHMMLDPDVSVETHCCESCDDYARTPEILQIATGYAPVHAEAFELRHASLTDPPEFVPV